MSSFDPSSKTVTFTNGDCTKIDTVIFCTGYLYTYPFLSPDLQISLQLSDTTGARVPNVYKQLFCIAEPTLAFAALPWNIVPFPVAEAQSAVVARVWSGRADIPSRTEMEAWEAERVQEMGDGKGYHNLAPPADVEYINSLWEWASSADEAVMNGEGRSEKHRVTKGKAPPYWGAFERWMRMRVPDIKGAFVARGEGRSSVTTLEELGFVFDEQDNDTKGSTVNGNGDVGRW